MDASPQDLPDNPASYKLLSPNMPTDGRPKIAIVSGENTNFRLSPENFRMPTNDDFLRKFDTMDSIKDLPPYLKPDFKIFQMSSATLHNKARPRLSRSIIGILEMGQVVRIGFVSLKALHIPQDRSTFVIVASPFHGVATASIGKNTISSAVVETPSGHDQARAHTIGQFIGDLAFENPRMGTSSQNGFVCLSQPVIGSQALPRAENTYNHRTGRTPQSGVAPICMTASEVRILDEVPMHPGVFTFDFSASFPLLPLPDPTYETNSVFLY